MIIFLFSPSLFGSVLSTSVLLKHFPVHEKTNALNSRGSDAHEKGGDVFYCFVKLFSKTEISRQAAVAFNVSAPGPAREIPSVRARTYFLFVEMKTQGDTMWGSVLGRRHCQYQLLFLLYL